MLYVLLSGKAPFEGATLVELIEAKEKGKVTPLRQYNEEVPERLGLIVEKMIATKPEHRYQSCAEVIVELETLGLATSHLSFFPPEGAKPAGPIAPKKLTMPRVVHATTAPANVPAETATPEESFWYAQLMGPDGKTVMRKLTKDQLFGMVKNQALDAETPVSRARGGPFRALGTYPEFVQLINARITKQKADKKAEKFKALYDKIDKEEKSRQRWRWIHNMYLKAGGLLGLILWLAVVAGVIIGGYFLVRWGLGQLREKLPV
jgi:serine/threonine-protein kinase